MGTYLQRANSSPSSQKKFTVSTWVKVCREGGDKYMWSMRTDDSNWIGCRFAVNGCIILQVYTSGSTTGQLQTNAFFRDFSAWYHVVVAVDTTQSTAGDRLKLYVNGSQETSFSTTTNPSLNADIPITSNFQVATSPYSSQYSSNSLDGYLAQFIYADNQAYSPSTFGSTNTNGIWIPNSSPSVTYGNNGFKLDFAGTGTAANASGFGADSSGNGNHFASNSLGTNPSTTDTCQNNFATLNPLSTSSFTSLSKGILVATGNTSANNGHTLGTMAPSAGKWYWEAKYVTAAGSTASNYPNVGVYPMKFSRQPLNGPNFAEAGYYSDGCEYRPDGSKFRNNSTSGYGTAWSTGDIIGVALDMENYAVYFSRNGTFQDSGDPTSGASKTGAAQSWSAAEGAYAVSCSSYHDSVMQFNFGNPVYTIASGNADANGYGSFEYAPPSGYYALCTKNLALYGG